jgi:hypothetical protein
MFRLRPDDRQSATTDPNVALEDILRKARFVLAPEFNGLLFGLSAWKPTVSNGADYRGGVSQSLPSP